MNDFIHVYVNEEHVFTIYFLILYFGLRPSGLIDY